MSSWVKKKGIGGRRKTHKNKKGGCIIPIRDGGLSAMPHVVQQSRGGQRQKVKLNNVYKKWQLPEKSSPSFTEPGRMLPN